MLQEFKNKAAWLFACLLASPFCYLGVAWICTSFNIFSGSSWALKKMELNNWYHAIQELYGSLILLEGLVLFIGSVVAYYYILKTDKVRTVNTFIVLLFIFILIMANQGQ